MIYACAYEGIWSKGQKNKQQNNAPSLKNTGAAGYGDRVKIELLKGAGVQGSRCLRERGHNCILPTERFKRSFVNNVILTI